MAFNLKHEEEKGLDPHFTFMSKQVARAKKRESKQLLKPSTTRISAAVTTKNLKSLDCDNTASTHEQRTSTATGVKVVTTSNGRRIEDIGGDSASLWRELR